MDEYNHDDFEVVSVDNRFGGFEVLEHKEPNMTHTRFFRKSLMPDDRVEFNNLMALQDHVLREGCSGTTHPIYEHDGKKWSLMSVPDQHYETTGLAA